MKRYVTLLSFLLSFSFLIPLISLGQYTVGDTVNNFTLSDIDNNPVSLYDYYGQVVLLNFWAIW